MQKKLLQDSSYETSNSKSVLLLDRFSSKKCAPFGSFSSKKCAPFWVIFTVKSVLLLDNIIVVVSVVKVKVVKLKVLEVLVEVEEVVVEV